MATVDGQGPPRPAAGPDVALQKGRELVRLWSEIETALEQHDNKRRRLQAELALASSSVARKVRCLATFRACEKSLERIALYALQLTGGCTRALELDQCKPTGGPEECRAAGTLARAPFLMLHPVCSYTVRSCDLICRTAGLGGRNNCPEG